MNSLELDIQMLGLCGIIPAIRNECNNANDSIVDKISTIKDFLRAYDVISNGEFQAKEKE